MTWELLDGEAPFLAAATADLADDAPKLIYADWLDERKDKRAAYLRKLVAAGAGGKHADVPAPSNEWHDLLGGHLTRYALGAKKLSAAERASLRVWMLRNARPSLSVKTKNVARTRQTIPLLASQAGGAPALPPDFIWPTRAACEIHDRPGIDFLSPDDPAEFLLQINCADVAATEAGRSVKGWPPEGMLSFFGAVEAAETPSAFGIAVHYFAEVGDLVATPAPYKRSASDPCGPLLFQETLDLPKLRGIDEATPTPRDWPKGSRQFVDELDPGSRCHVLGHAEPAMGETLAEANKWVHLMHPWAVFGRWREQPNVQVRPADLKARKFHKVRLVWPDGMFDL